MTAVTVSGRLSVFSKHERLSMSNVLMLGKYLRVSDVGEPVNAMGFILRVRVVSKHF